MASVEHNVLDVIEVYVSRGFPQQHSPDHCFAVDIELSTLDSSRCQFRRLVVVPDTDSGKGFFRRKSERQHRGIIRIYFCQPHVGGLAGEVSARDQTEINDYKRIRQDLLRISIDVLSV